MSKSMVLTYRSGDDHAMVKKLTDKGSTMFGDKYDSQVMATVKMLDRRQTKTGIIRLRDGHRHFYGVLAIL